MRGSLKADDKDKKEDSGQIFYDEKLRIMTISGYINDTLADTFFSHFMTTFETKASRKPVKFYINSGGGDMYAVFKFFDHITSSPIPFITIVCGEAFSGAFILFLAGSRRLIHANATLGFHVPTRYLSRGDTGEGPNEAIGIACHQKDLWQRMIGIVKRNSNMSERLIRDHFGFTKRINADTALKFGLAHEIIGPAEKVLPKNW